MICRALSQRPGLWCLGLTAALLAGAGRPARADVSLPNIFGSHMVLQQKQKDRVWGKADPGEEVSVSIADQTKSTKAGQDGQWSVVLDPLSVDSHPLTMTVKGKNTITFDDVLVGEVWVCSGQSNMQMSVQGSNDADLESLTAQSPQIRLISVPQVGTQEPQDNFNGHWTACTPDTVRNFSAVGYFFGRELHHALHVPVGLINDAWGGSACEAWVNREPPRRRREVQGTARPLGADRKGRRRLPPETGRLQRKPSRRPRPTAKRLPNRRTIPRATLRGNERPGNIYNGVLKPTIGYGIRGAIWYQGETNAGRAYQYRELFPLMIQNWRDEWGIGDFPFYWVQLADFMGEKPEPGESAWAELREAQTMTMSKLPNTGEAVIIDIGEANDIHPRNKLDVGRRLARWALARDYGVKIAHHSPQYQEMKKDGKKIVLTIDHVGSGLRTFDVHEPRGFAIAGSDHKFVWAQAKLVGNNKVEVWSDAVAEPVAVRYAWADNPVCNVYSRDGLPLTPFRTDDWPGVTAENRK